MSFSHQALFLSNKGWIREGSSKHGFIKVVIWHKDGTCDGCQQWEAIQIERDINKKSRLAKSAPKPKPTQ